MILDRLDEVTIGKPCEVDGCSTVCVDGEDRCHDHSIHRMIEALFTIDERCRFGGVTCTVQATVCNEHDVPMCETCYSQWTRIQAGRQWTRSRAGRRSLPEIITARVSRMEFERRQELRK